MLETGSPTQKEDEQITPIYHEVNNDVKNVTYNIDDNFDNSTNFNEDLVPKNNEGYIIVELVIDVIVSKKSAKKSKRKAEKKKATLKAKRTPSKKTPTPSKTKKTPKRKEDIS